MNGTNSSAIIANLLDALRQIMALAEQRGPDDGEYHDIARAAIAKAEGK